MKRIEDVAAQFDGDVSLAARDLRTGAVVASHPDRKCPTASVIKLPVLVHVLMLAGEGCLSMDEEMVLRRTDKVPGSGILTQLTDGLRLPLRDACTLMIALSDNTATNLVLDRVGIEGVNVRMRSLGLRETRLFRKVFSSGPPISPANKRYGLGVTTPADMIRLLLRIHRGQAGGPQTCAMIREVLATQQGRDAIPRLLPAGCSYQGKGGAVDAVRNDVGFVTTPDGREVALAIFCQNIPTPLWTPDNPGVLAIARLAQLIVEEFSRPAASG